MTALIWWKRAWRMKLSDGTTPRGLCKAANAILSQAYLNYDFRSLIRNSFLLFRPCFQVLIVYRFRETLPVLWRKFGVVSGEHLFFAFSFLFHVVFVNRREFRVLSRELQEFSPQTWNIFCGDGSQVLAQKQINSYQTFFSLRRFEPSQLCTRIGDRVAFDRTANANAK